MRNRHTERQNDEYSIEVAKTYGVNKKHIEFSY